MRETLSDTDNRLKVLEVEGKTNKTKSRLNLWATHSYMCDFDFYIPKDNGTIQTVEEKKNEKKSVNPTFILFKTPHSRFCSDFLRPNSCRRVFFF